MRLTGAMLDTISCILGWAEASGWEEITQGMPEESEALKFEENAKKAHEWVWQEQARREAKKKRRQNKRRSAGV